MVMFVIDGSSAQRRIDWAAAATVTAGGWEKVTEGQGYVNPYWADAKQQMAELRGAGALVPGAYLFLHEGDGGGQARYFADHAGDLAGFGITIDAEPTGSSRPTLADVNACVAALRAEYPAHQLGGYMPHWYWGSQPTTAPDWLWASEYLAGMGSPAALYTRVPASWWDGYGGSPVRLLQFTSSGLVPGVQGTIDCSAFRGTPAEYAAMVLPGGTPPPPPPPPTWQEAMMRALPELSVHSGARDDVRRAQALLRPAGVPVAVDGVFGPDTEAAVKSVQRSHFGDAGADGVVGPHTWAVLVTGRDL